MTLMETTKVTKEFDRLFKIRFEKNWINLVVKKFKDVDVNNAKDKNVHNSSCPRRFILFFLLDWFGVNLETWCQWASVASKLMILICQLYMGLE